MKENSIKKLLNNYTIIYENVQILKIGNNEFNWNDFKLIRDNKDFFTFLYNFKNIKQFNLDLKFYIIFSNKIYIKY